MNTRSTAASSSNFSESDGRFAPSFEAPNDAPSARATLQDVHTNTSAAQHPRSQFEVGPLSMQRSVALVLPVADVDECESPTDHIPCAPPPPVPVPLPDSGLEAAELTRTQILQLLRAQFPPDVLKQIKPGITRDGLRHLRALSEHHRQLLDAGFSHQQVVDLTAPRLPQSATFILQHTQALMACGATPKQLLAMSNREETLPLLQGLMDVGAQLVKMGYDLEDLQAFEVFRSRTVVMMQLFVERQRRGLPGRDPHEALKSFIKRPPSMLRFSIG